MKYLFLFAILLCLTHISCTDNKTASGPGRNEPAPVIEEQKPIHEIPGLHLLYTVNDRLTGTFTSDLTARVLIAEPDGSRREILFEYPEYIFHMTPSPTGETIAFVGNTKGEDGQKERHLFLYDIKTGYYRDVSVSGFYSRAVHTGPVFSPDGRWVVFLSRWAVDSGEYNIFKCDVETGLTSGLYTDPVEDVPLTLSPDGSGCVAARRLLSSPGTLDYISIDIESGTSEILHHFENVTKIGPAHFDDSGSFLFCDIKPSDDIPVGEIGVRSREVLSINLDNGTTISLMEPNTVTYIYQVFRNSENELTLLLRRQENIEGEETPISRIAVCGIDGSNFTYLTDTSAKSYLYGQPPKNNKHISPDNSYMFFYRQDPLFEHEDIWVMRPDGSDAVNVSDTAGYIEGAAGWIVIPE